MKSQQFIQSIPSTGLDLFLKNIQATVSSNWISFCASYVHRYLTNPQAHAPCSRCSTKRRGICCRRWIPTGDRRRFWRQRCLRRPRRPFL